MFCSAKGMAEELAVTAPYPAGGGSEGEKVAMMPNSFAGKGGLSSAVDRDATPLGPFPFRIDFLMVWAPRPLPVYLPT